MYKVPQFIKSSIKSITVIEGETIEQKVSRILNNKEPIKDGASIVYTERKDGVKPAYNVRTDRWEIAAEAMDSIHRGKAARSEGKAEMKVNKTPSVEDGTTSGSDGKPEPTQGTKQQNS